MSGIKGGGVFGYDISKALRKLIAHVSIRVRIVVPVLHQPYRL